MTDEKKPPTQYITASVGDMQMFGNPGGGPFQTVDDVLAFAALFDRYAAADYPEPRMQQAGRLIRALVNACEELERHAEAKGG